MNLYQGEPERFWFQLTLNKEHGENDRPEIEENV